LNTGAAAHNPKPADHYMTELGPPDTEPQSVQFLKDYVGADYHNDGHSHVDALCHIAYEGLMYNGRSAGAVTNDGAEVNTIRVLKAGLIGRGVLLDIPRLRGMPGSNRASTCSGTTSRSPSWVRGTRPGRRPGYIPPR